jgi:hypothetical protein
MTKIKTIVKPKSSSDSSNGGSSVSITSSQVGTFDAVTTNTINANSGTISNIKSQTIDTNDLNASTVKTSVVNANNVNSKGAAIADITSNDITNEGNITTSTLESNKITGTNGFIDNIYNSKIKSGNAEIDYAKIKELLSDSATVQDLTVTGKAHFFELIIDTIKAASGSVLLTPADGFEVDGYVKNTTSNTISLFWQCEQGSKGRYNMWKVNDQAICQNFNNASIGTSYNVSNKLWWACVTAVSGSTPMYGYYDSTNNIMYSDSSTLGSSDSTNTITYSNLWDNEKQSLWTLAAYDIYLKTTANEDSNYNDSKNGYYTYTYKFVNEYNALTDTEKANYTLMSSTAYFRRTENDTYIFTTKDKYDSMSFISKSDCNRYHWIKISTTNCLSSSVFNISVGDSVAMLGYQGTDDANRQSAVYISAYDSLDLNLKAPLIAQYRGINDFSLSTHRKSYFDATSAEFIGTFKVISNSEETDLDQYIKNNINGVIIDKESKEYGASSDKSTQPTTWTTTIPEMSSTNKYIWERESTTYKSINEDTRNIVIGTSSDWKSNATYIQLTTYLGIDLTKSNGIITVSFDAKAPDGNSSTNNYNFGIHLKDKNGVNLHDASGDTSVIQNWTTVGHIPTNSTHYVYTIDLSSIITQNGHSVSEVGQMLIMLCYSGIADGSGCYTKNLKITVNTEESDWSPAPEDLNSKVDPHIIAVYAEDTEFYKLVDNASYAAIDASKNLVLKLNYYIVHVVGKASEVMTTTPSGYKIYWNYYNSDSTSGSWTEFTSSLSNNCYTYNSTVANSTSKVNVEVNLNDASGNTIDSKIIPVVFLAGAAFSVTDTINAAVQSNTGDISTLQQTASGLETKVSSFHLGESNLFGFNRGIDFGNTRPCPEFYGLAVSGKTGESCTNYRISNLGFNGTQGVGETYIVECQIKMQTTARTLNINLCDVTARNGKSIFNATTDWKDFIGIFDNVNDFNYVGNYNGFLDIENDTESLTNWAFIKNLKITKSTIKTDFCIADEDHVVDKASLISDWITNSLEIETDKINNYTVYKTTSNPTTSVNNINYCYKNDYTIKNNQTYTLSFWAKADKEAVISSFFYPSMEVPNIPNFCPMDGYTLSTVTTSWKHYFIYWHTNLDTSANNYLVKNILPICMNYSTNSNNASAVVEFYGVKFAEGYVAEDNYYESLIKQTASDIELKVKNTGINIDDGTITLDATKTTVKGNLAISQYTDGEGLTVYDSDGIPRIGLRTDDMSDVTSMINGSGTSGSLSGYYTWSAQSGMEIHSIETDTYTTATIGTFKVNDTINLSKMVVTFTGVNEYIMYTARLMMNGTIIATLGSGTLYGSANGAQYVNLSDYSYTVTTAGTYNVMLTATVVVLKYTQAYIYSVHPTVYIDGRVKRITTQEIILSKDGLAVNSGVDRWLYISDSEIQLRWMDQGIRLTNNRIYQLYANASGTTSWGAFGSKKHFVNVTSTTYTLETEYDFVILNGTTSTLIVGTDQCYDGRYIRVKDMCSGNAYINFKGTPVLYCDDIRTTDTNKNIELAGNHLRDYTYSLDIGAWIEGYLS